MVVLVMVMTKLVVIKGSEDVVLVGTMLTLWLYWRWVGGNDGGCGNDIDDGRVVERWRWQR